MNLRYVLSTTIYHYAFYLVTFSIKYTTISEQGHATSHALEAPNAFQQPLKLECR